MHHTLGGSLSKWDPGERSGYLTSRDPGAEAEPGWARMPWDRRVLERVEKGTYSPARRAPSRRTAGMQIHVGYSSRLFFFFVRVHICTGIGIRRKPRGLCLEKRNGVCVSSNSEKVILSSFYRNFITTSFRAIVYSRYHKKTRIIIITIRIII